MGDDVPAEFAAVCDSWKPAPVIDTDVVTAHPANTFAALLDQPSPMNAPGDELPPLWHWFMFPPHYRSDELGADGHADGAFTPPLSHRRRMFGGGRLTVQAPLRLGDRVVRESRVSGVRATRGSTGWLLLVTVAYELSVDGQLRCREEQDLVYRPPGQGSAAPTTRLQLPSSQWQLRWRPDPVSLFRFSALTNNAHRIHYDRPYAVDVEGHAGLVVHGPLLALLMLELPRRHAPERRVATMSWRARTPLFDSDEVIVSALDGTSLTAGCARTGPAVTATVSH